jgi:hypothetical protein
MKMMMEQEEGAAVRRGALAVKPVTKLMVLPDSLKEQAKKLVDTTKAKEDTDKNAKELADKNAKELADKSAASSDKILGMPKMVAIGLGVVLLAIGGFFAYKKFKKK